MAIVIHTSNPVYVHELSWTIEHFSRTPLELRSPDFLAIPGFWENFCIEMIFVKVDSKYENYSALRFHLVCLTAYPGHINVSSRITLRNTDDAILAECNKLITEVKKKELVRSYFKTRNKRDISSEWKLLQDKLILKGTLSFSAYNIESCVSSNFVEKSPGDQELIEVIKTMYETDFTWDVTFFVDVQTLHAHKAIICSRSPVFAKMFSLDMQEKNSNSVCIQDVKPHAFNCFLLYLYTSTIEDKQWDTVLTLYSLANKYEVPSLRKECSRILGNNLTIDSVCSVLVLADLHGDMELKEAGKNFLQTHVFQVVGTTQWVKIVSTKPQLAKEVLESTK